MCSSGSDGQQAGGDRDVIEKTVIHACLDRALQPFV